MRNNNTKIFLLILIGITGFLIYKSQVVDLQETDFNKTEIQLVQESSSEVRKNPQQAHVKKLIDTPIDTNFNEENLTDIEIITTFDDEPIVDAEIIRQKYQHCSRMLLFLKDKKYKKHYHKSYTKLKTNNPDYYNKHLEYCQNVNTKHPEYNLAQNDNKDETIPNSYLGRLLDDGEFAESQMENDIESVKRALINADPNLMLSYHAFMGYLTFDLDLRLILESQQVDYTSTIGKYARILFACRLGADCGENSDIVFSTCLNNENLCSNDIEELIKSKFSNGQQADIELAYQHLINYYNVNE